MNEIRGLFDRLLEEPAPPLPPSADIIAAGRRARRRRNHRIAGGVTAFVMAGVLGVVGLFAVNPAATGEPPMPPVGIGEPSGKPSVTPALALTAADFDQADVLFAASTTDAIAGVWHGTWLVRRDDDLSLRWYLSYIRRPTTDPCLYAVSEPFPARPRPPAESGVCTKLMLDGTEVWVWRWIGTTTAVMQVHVPLGDQLSVVCTMSNVELEAWGREPGTPPWRGPIFVMDDAEVLDMARAITSPSNLATHLALAEHLLQGG